MEKVECPYCEEYVEINPQSVEHYEGDKDYICPLCEKQFTVYAEPTVYYCTADKQKKDHQC